MKLYPAQQMCTGHNKQESSLQKSEEEHNQEEFQQEDLSAQHFTFCTENDVLGLGHPCAPSQVSCPNWLEAGDGLQTVVGQWFCPSKSRTLHQALFTHQRSNFKQWITSLYKHLKNWTDETFLRSSISIKVSWIYGARKREGTKPSPWKAFSSIRLI